MRRELLGPCQTGYPRGFLNQPPGLLGGPDPRWGVRALEDVTRVAESHGFVQTRVVAMPANNLTVVFVRG